MVTDSTLFKTIKSYMKELMGEHVVERLTTMYSEFERLDIDEMKQKVSELMEEVEASPYYAEVREKVTETFNEIKEKYPAVWEMTERTMSGLIERLTTLYSEFERLDLDEMKQKVYELMEEVVASPYYAEVREKVTETFNEIKEKYPAVWEITERTMNELERKAYEVYESEETQEVFAWAERLATKIWESLKGDLEEYSEWMMGSRQARKIVNYSMRLVNEDRLLAKEVVRIVNEVIQEVMCVSLEADSNGVRVFIPTHRPLTALPQYLVESASPVALLEKLYRFYMSHIPKPVENMIWAYYTFVPHTIAHVTDLVAPFTRVAMIVDGTEILTFDGKVVRVPRSPCKLVLAAHATHKLYMAHTEGEKNPELELELPETKVVVKPNLEVLVNGNPAGAEERIGKVFVIKTSKYIEIKTPMLKVIVPTKGGAVAVHASGWAFGRIAGLLGAYDGEINTDFIEPTGERTLESHRLASAWRTEESCEIREEERSERVSAQRVIECEMMLGMRARCNAVVRPEAFIKMCHRTTSPCEAARAYRTICAIKGVAEIFELDRC